MVTNADFVRQARLWLGTPYHHQGRTRGVFCDCIGLVYGVAVELGIAPDGMVIPPYSRMPDPARLMASIELAANSVLKPYRDTVRVGDIALMAFGTNPLHLGIVGDHQHRKFSLIHAYAHTGEVVEHGLDDEWHRRIKRLYRMRELSYE